MEFSIRKENDHGLCGSCENAHIRTYEDGSHLVLCGAHRSPPVQRVVVECNEYVKVGSMDIYKMEKVAFILERSKGKVIGFLSPVEYKIKHPKERELTYER